MGGGKAPPRFRRKPKTKTRKRRVQKVSIQPRRSNIKTYSSNVGMPLRKFVKLTYFENLVFNPSAAGTMSSWNFLLNSVFDPNSSGVGSQPLGHNEMETFYKQYRVHSAKISVQFANGESNVFPVYCGIAADKNGTLDAELNTKIEATKGTASRLLLANSNNTKFISQNVSMKKFFSVKNVSDDHQLQAPTTANPILQCYGIVWAQFPAGHPGTISKSIIVSVKIDYNVEYFDPVELVGS